MDPQFAAIFYPLLASIPRLAAAFTILPLFGKRTVQGLIRSEFILVLALFVYPSALPIEGAAPTVFGSFVVIAFKEAIIGLLLGFFLGTIFWVAENVGYLIDLQTGTHNALIFDPMHDHQEGPTATFMLQFVVVLVLAGGGFLTLLEIIFESYRIWPIFETTPRVSELFVKTVSARADTLFVTTVQFAAPIIILLLLVEIGLGLLNRVADHVDVYSLAMPIKSSVAFFVLLVFLSFVYDSIKGFLANDNQVLRAIREAFL
jgi:type III secretion protein T